MNGKLFLLFKCTIWVHWIGWNVTHIDFNDSHNSRREQEIATSAESMQESLLVGVHVCGTSMRDFSFLCAIRAFCINTLNYPKHKQCNWQNGFWICFFYASYCLLLFRYIYRGKCSDFQEKYYTKSINYWNDQAENKHTWNCIANIRCSHFWKVHSSGILISSKNYSNGAGKKGQL